MSFDLKKKLKTYRLSELEYHKICDLLNREPQSVEWALFSALWSEHCSYKSSKIHLRKFAKTMNSSVVNASGENAGIVDLGFNERIAFKMESHNHPSFIEPYQGAATGVGGILRDIFTMGARPISLANYLCFGEIHSPRMPELMDGVVRGISGYGNCVGVPTVTGQTNFDSSYDQNILVNAMAVGLLKGDDQVALSGAKGVGNLVVYVGAKTGKDGVHGAAMASESFDEDSESKKPNVQIGDPYFEKLLIESCLEVIQKQLVVSIQDMGAAGLTSSSFEMASKGQLGMQIDLGKVPLRDSSMNPEEILLSESQERMLLICEPEKFSEIEKHFHRWGLDVAVIGEVVKDRKVTLSWRGEILTSLDPDLLVENAPVYERPYQKWQPKKTSAQASKESLKNFLEKRIQDPRFSSRKPIYRQYDQRVGAQTAHGAESDVSIQRLSDSGRGLATAVGCRPKLMQIDAQLGAFDSIVYPCLQMAAKGAKAVAITDCLNFGNPEKPEIMSQFVASVEAIVDAAMIFEAPVVSGNVSFYNETQGKNITSTPATGLIGIRDHVDRLAKDYFTNPGQTVLLLRLNSAELSSNGYQGEVDLQGYKKLAERLISLDQQNLFQSSQVVGLGGLAWCLTKMSADGMGFQAHEVLSEKEWMQDLLYQVVLVSDQPKALIKQIAESELRNKLEVVEIGITGGDEISFSSLVKFPIKSMQESYQQALAPYFQGL